MGFRPKVKVWRLVWAEDHDLHGLEVEARAMRLGNLLDLGKMADQARGGAGFAEITGMCETVASVITSWNRESNVAETLSDGTAVQVGDVLPTTMAGMAALEDWEFMAIVDAYMSAGMRTPDDDLGKGSPSGKPSPVELPPMDEL